MQPRRLGGPTRLPGAARPAEPPRLASRATALRAQVPRLERHPVPTVPWRGGSGVVVSAGAGPPLPGPRGLHVPAGGAAGPGRGAGRGGRPFKPLRAAGGDSATRGPGWARRRGELRGGEFLGVPFGLPRSLPGSCEEAGAPAEELAAGFKDEPGVSVPPRGCPFPGALCVCVCDQVSAPGPPPLGLFGT